MELTVTNKKHERHIGRTAQSQHFSDCRPNKHARRRGHSLKRDMEHASLHRMLMDYEEEYGRARGRENQEKGYAKDIAEVPGVTPAP